MKETPRAFEARTHQRYRPVVALTRRGRALQPDEPCPTLFRYPGPIGLARLLQGATAELAPDDTRFVWLAETSATLRPRGARLFGSIAVVEPLRLAPVRAVDPDGNDVWLARDRRVHEGQDVAWVPPTLVGAPFDWDRLARAGQVAERLGAAAYASERGRTVDQLAAYVEELNELARCGAFDPARPWHEVDPAERRRLLASCGIAPRFSR